MDSTEQKTPAEGQPTAPEPTEPTDAPQPPPVAPGLIVLGDQDGAGQCDVDGECR